MVIGDKQDGCAGPFLATGMDPSAQENPCWCKGQSGDMAACFYASLQNPYVGLWQLPSPWLLGLTQEE